MAWNTTCRVCGRDYSEHQLPCIHLCETWTDHVWSEPRFVENGRHQTQGRYTRFLVTCERCGRETTETRWLDILTNRGTDYRV